MRLRAALTAVLIGSLAVAAVGGSPVATASSGSAPAGRTAAVTASGTFERVAVDTVDGEDLRYQLRSSARTWWLEGLAGPVPSPGSDVEVTGAPLDEYTLRVDSIRVTSAALDAAGATPRATRVLVLRPFWGPRPPARPTSATTRAKVVAASKRWFEEVSHGRYTVSGAVRPWLRVTPPESCLEGATQVQTDALAAAQRAGYRLRRFQRFITYMPCRADEILGYASTPGRHVVLFNMMMLSTVTHEQGHNLGLEHASALECTHPRWGSVTWSSSCEVVGYGDEIDAMGNRRAGHYNAYFKSRLGWLQQATTVRSTRTVTMAPYEPTGPGVKAIRLRTGGATYWLEYRTRVGADRRMRPGTSGVQIRHQVGAETYVLDAGPESTTGYYDLADTHLPAGSSWTTPQNVRITVTGQTPSAATVEITFGAGAPKAPKSPAPVFVQAVDDAVEIRWTRPADNGAIIRRYVITRSDGTRWTMSTFAGQDTAFSPTGPAPSTPYWFWVRAVNEAGASVAAKSPTVEPRYTARVDRLPALPPER